MRCLSARKIEHYFVDVTPAPPFRWIKGFDDRVFGRVKMFCSVSIWRLIATTDMATAAADPQMQPGVAQFQTFFAPQGARNNVTDRREMFAKCRHIYLPRNERRAQFVSVLIQLRSYASPCARAEAGRNKRLTNPGWAGCDGTQAIITHGIFSTDLRVQ